MEILFLFLFTFLQELENLFFFHLFVVPLQRNQQSKQVYIAERPESTKYWPVLVNLLTIKKIKK